MESNMAYDGITKELCVYKTDFINKYNRSKPARDCQWFITQCQFLFFVILSFPCQVVIYIASTTY